MLSLVMLNSGSRSLTLPIPSNPNEIQSPSQSPATELPKRKTDSQSRSKMKLKSSRPPGRPKSNPKLVSSRNRKTDALRRLGLEVGERIGVPKITHILKSAEGGIPQVLEALRGSEEEIAQRFVQKFDGLSESDRGFVSIEDVATACCIDTPTLLGVATKALFSQQQQVSAVIAATAHPLVVQKTVQNALQDKGVRDREMLHTAVGFLPTPKGATIISQRFQIANIHEPEKTVEVEGPQDLMQFDEDVRGLHSLASTGKALELAGHVLPNKDPREVTRG